MRKLPLVNFIIASHIPSTRDVRRKPAATGYAGQPDMVWGFSDWLFDFGKIPDKKAVAQSNATKREKEKTSTGVTGFAKKLLISVLESRYREFFAVMVGTNSK